jgi:glycosyltransferase involved in cell wall biosynthesis
MKILFLVPYPAQEAPSQRFRFEQYFSALEKAGIDWDVQSFLDSQNWQTFYKSGKMFSKGIALLAGFAKRLAAVFRSINYDFVFIHREAAPVGPPIFEWLIAKVMRKKIIYDFDDAIWLTDKVNESGIEKIIRWRNKVGSICKWSYKVSCGNEYLCNYAKQFNNQVALNPTTIDTVNLHRINFDTQKSDKLITIGWTGSHSTLKYLDEVIPVIQKLEQKYPLRFLVIANKEPKIELNSLDFIPWTIATEIEDLLQIDIGIMPLPNDEWTKGKCGFKALQYMALEIPAVVSAVGVNTKIIESGVNGFICQFKEEWLSRLELLIQNEELRKRIGKQGRLKVEKDYSVVSNSSTFLSLFR